MRWKASKELGGVIHIVLPPRFLSADDGDPRELMRVFDIFGHNVGLAWENYFLYQ